MVPGGERLTGVPGKGQEALFPRFAGAQTLTGKTRDRDLAGIFESSHGDTILFEEAEDPSHTGILWCSVTSLSLLVPS